MKKNKKAGTRLPADERPLFAPWHSVHKTAKDKAASRQNRKKQLKKELDDYKE